MRVIDIHPPKSKWINLCLEKGMMNDQLYETNYFVLELEDIEPIEFLYRRMFETRYLRRKHYNVTPIPENGKTHLQISISEAISFVKAATPPIFQDKVKELYNSLESLSNSLKLYLMEENAELEFHLSLFKRHIGLNQFETVYDYDFNRTNLLRKNIPISYMPITDFMVFNADINDIYNGDILGDTHEDEDGSVLREATGVNVHLMYNCIKKKDLEFVYAILNDVETRFSYWPTEIHILNIFHTEFGGYFVEIYVEDYDSGVCESLESIFKSTYKKILNK